MKLDIYQVDAFTNQCFHGNPAAVVPLASWLPDTLLQQIAAENNLSETAFFVPSEKPDCEYHIRWFTPTIEVSLCGHATLATAHVLKHHMAFAGDSITFDSQSGPLQVYYDNDKIQLDFPADPPEPETDSTLIELVKTAISADVIDVHRSKYFLARLHSKDAVLSVQPDINIIKQLPSLGLIITSEAEEYDFVSRFFAPNAGVDEDPVTGSAHCILTPFWANQLDRNQFNAKQVSTRGGEMECELRGERVLMRGVGKTYLVGSIEV